MTFCLFQWDFGLRFSIYLRLHREEVDEDAEKATNHGENDELQN